LKIWKKISCQSLLIRTTRKARRRFVPAFAKNQTKRRKNYRESKKQKGKKVFSQNCRQISSYFIKADYSYPSNVHLQRVVKIAV
jgi:hypothetical protein